MRIDPETRLKHAAHTAYVVEADFDEDAADTIHIAHLDEPGIIMVQGPGSVMWELLEEPLSMRALTEQVAEIYGEDTATVSPGVEQFVADLLEKDLLDSTDQ